MKITTASGLTVTKNRDGEGDMSSVTIQARNVNESVVWTVYESWKTFRGYEPYHRIKVDLKEKGLNETEITTLGY